MRRLECWITLDGNTACCNCAISYTGSKPVALLPPRTCYYCKKPIVQIWPEKQFWPEDKE